MTVEKNNGFAPPCPGAIEVIGLSRETKQRAVKSHNSLPTEIRYRREAWAVEGTKCSNCSFRVRVAYNGERTKQEVSEWEDCPMMYAGRSGVIYRSFR